MNTRRYSNQDAVQGFWFVFLATFVVRDIHTPPFPTRPQTGNIYGDLCNPGRTRRRLDPLGYGGTRGQLTLTDAPSGPSWNASEPTSYVICTFFFPAARKEPGQRKCWCVRVYVCVRVVVCACVSVVTSYGTNCGLRITNECGVWRGRRGYICFWVARGQHSSRSVPWLTVWCACKCKLLRFRCEKHTFVVPRVRRKIFNCQESHEPLTIGIVMV